LLALGRETIQQQREVEPSILRARHARLGLERRALVFEEQLGFPQEAPDQRALAVVDTAASDEAQQPLALELVEAVGYLRDAQK
jgi:hypothetical protein